MPSSHLILCRPLLLLPPTPPSIRVFSNESALRIRWPKYWSFSFSISPCNEHPGLISFRTDWLDHKFLLRHKKDAFESVLVRRMKLESVIQSKVSQREKQVLYINTYIQNLKKWYCLDLYDPCTLLKAVSGCFPYCWFPSQSLSFALETGVSGNFHSAGCREKG